MCGCRTSNRVVCALFSTTFFRVRIDLKKAVEDGARFHKALLDVSFDIGSYDMNKPVEFEKERLETLVKAFRNSFETEAALSRG